MKDSQRCQYPFALCDKKGKKCGLEKAPGTFRCFWHRPKEQWEIEDNERSKWKERRKELEELVKRGAYLEGAWLQWARLESVQEEINLAGAQFPAARLVRADLRRTDMAGSCLEGADVAGADFRRADLSGARLLRAQNIFTTNPQPTRFERVIWGKEYERPEERERGEGCKHDDLEEGYRWLKLALRQSGSYEEAAEFYFREMECKRKGEKWFSWQRFKLGFSKHSCGYGERLWKIGLWMGGVVVVGGVVLSEGKAIWDGVRAISKGLYWSVVVFTTLGMGQPPSLGGWGQLWVAFEALAGAFLMALFVVTFARKAMRG